MTEHTREDTVKTKLTGSILLSTVLLTVNLSAKSTNDVQCDIQIESVKNSADTYTLVLKHNQNCEIIMDHNKSHISLVSKGYEYTNALPASEINSTVTNTKVEKLITLAKTKEGDSYEPAKAGPDHFDCSGFVYYLFKENGIALPRASLQQSKAGEKLTRKALKRGDILFFDTHAREHVNHSAVYLGNGKFIHSSSGKAYGVTVSELDKGFYKDKFRWGIRKIESD